MAATIRTGTAAINWAKAQAVKATRDWNNWCLRFVRMCFGVAAVHPNAKSAWLATKKRHETKNAASIPAGVPVWFQTSTKNWHVALSAGNGKCYSSDVPRGKIGLIGIDALCKSWGITLLGWSEDINGVTVYTAPVRRVPPFPVGIGPKKSKPSAKPLQKILKAAGFMAKSVTEADNYGPKTRAAVVAFHNRYSQFRAKGVKSDNKIGPQGWKFLHENWG